MSDPTPPTNPATVPANAAPAPARPVPNFAQFFAALGNPLRWEMVRMIADGRALSASDVAKTVRRNFDGVSKHLRILERAGVVICRRGEDRRFGMYSVPDSVRRADGVLDYGFCVIRPS